MYLIEEENLNPAETIMIGDSLNSDYLPAEQIGIYSLLLDRYNVYEQVEQVNIVKSLDEALRNYKPTAIKVISCRLVRSYSK